MRSYQIYSRYVPCIQAIFSCPTPSEMQDIPSRIIAYPSQQFRAAAPGQVTDGTQFLCKTEVLLTGFRRNYFCPFTEDESYTGRLIRDCVHISLGVGSRLSCSLSVLYLWVLSTRLTKDSKLCSPFTIQWNFELLQSSNQGLYSSNGVYHISGFDWDEVNLKTADTVFGLS